MHSTNKAFECYFEIESDKVRAELVDLPGCNGALSNAIDMFYQCGADGWVKKYEEELEGVNI